MGWCILRGKRSGATRTTRSILRLKHRSTTRERVQGLRQASRRSLGRYREVLTDPNAALLLGANFLSEIGDWFNTIALISLSYGFSGDARDVGGMLALRMVPRLLFQGPAGALVDRRSGRSLLFTTQLLMAASASSFALLTAAPNRWLLYLLVLLLETVNTVARPAFMVQLRTEVLTERRAAMNGVLAIGMTSAQFVGPLLGAGVLALFGAVWVFVVNGLTFLCVAAAVTRLRGGLDSRRIPLMPHGAPGSEDAHLASGNAEAASDYGYGWLLRRLDLSLYGALSLSNALLIQGTVALFVVRADDLGLGDGAVGLFYVAVAVGAVVGSALAGSSSASGRGSLYRVAAAAALCGVAIATFGAAGWIGLAFGALVVAGFATDFHEVIALTFFQNRLPDRVYGRFFSFFLTSLNAGGLVGALLGPVLATAVGVPAAVALLAVPGFVFALALAGAVRRQAFPDENAGR